MAYEEKFRMALASKCPKDGVILLANEISWRLGKFVEYLLKHRPPTIQSARVKLDKAQMKLWIEAKDLGMNTDGLRSFYMKQWEDFSRGHVDE